MELIIKTTDKAFFQSLCSAKIKGVEVAQRTGFTDTCITDGTTQHLVSIIVSFTNNVASGLVAAWLYEYFKNKNTHETTINSQKITNNITVINTIILGDGQVKVDQNQSDNNRD